VKLFADFTILSGNQQATRQIRCWNLACSRMVSWLHMLRCGEHTQLHYRFYKRCTIVSNNNEKLLRFIGLFQKNLSKSLLIAFVQYKLPP